MATKVDIVSGFLGAGKTTLINKLLDELAGEERVAVIENEVGEIGIDGQILERNGIQVREVTNGCICCTLFGDFVTSLRDLLDQYELDRIIVEPTGVGRLSDVIKACTTAGQYHELQYNILATVVDCSKWGAFSTTFGDFFKDQVGGADVVFLSRVAASEKALIEHVVRDVARLNPGAQIISSCWESAAGGVVAMAEQGRADPAQWASQMATQNIDFESWSVETGSEFTAADLQHRLAMLENSNKAGDVVRGKGVVRAGAGRWLRFDYLPGEITVRPCAGSDRGRIVMIGSSINATALAALFESGDPE